MILVNQFTYSQTNWTVGDLIRYGQMNRQLVRPLSPFFDTLSSELAGKVVYLAFDIPIVIILALLLKPELNPTPQQVLAFIPALVLAWALGFLWGYWLALLAFWATRADALLAVQDSLVFLLAGQVGPVALLPGLLHTLAVALPFRYMVGFPVEVLMGQVDSTSLVPGLAICAGWLTLALLLTVFMWKLGLRRYSAVGGG